VRSYWENVREHIRNLGNILGTHRKLVVTKWEQNKSNTPPLLPPKEIMCPFGCMLPHLIGCKNNNNNNCSLPFFPRLIMARTPTMGVY